MSKKEQLQDRGAWDNYWTGTDNESTFGGFGPQDSVLAAFWDKTFRSALASGRSQILDLAAGNGTLSKRLLELAPDDSVSQFATDFSLAACRELSSRCPGTGVFVSDASRLSCAPASMDFIVSQFGMEYAESSIDSALSALSPGGQLTALCHAKGGTIYNECNDNFKATQDFLKTKILESLKKAISYVEKQHKKKYQKQLVEAEQSLGAATHKCNSLFAQFGQQVASGMLFKIYRELFRLYNNLEYIPLKEAVDWIEQSKKELESYTGRMSSMLNAAKEKAFFEEKLGNHRSGYAEVLPFYGKVDLSGNNLLAWHVSYLKSD